MCNLFQSHQQRHPMVTILDSPLTRIHGRPTPRDILCLKQELAANAMSIPSVQGGAYGYIALVLSEEELLTITDTPFVIPQHPGQPPNHAADASYAEVRNAENKYDYQVEQFNTYIYIRNGLRAQIIAAVDRIYLDELRDPVFGFGKVTPFELLQHLITNYGQVTFQDIQNNRDQLQKPWNPDKDHIVTLWTRIKNCQAFALYAKDFISDATAMMFTLNVLAASGVLSESILEWKRLDSSQQTLPYFFEHFGRGYRVHMDCQQYN